MVKYKDDTWKKLTFCENVSVSFSYYNTSTIIEVQ